MRKILRSSLVCAYAALVLAIAACGIGRVEAGERQKPLADLPMTLIGDRYGVAENVDQSRSTALDLMRAHPDLRAIVAFGSQGPSGAARD